MERHSRLSKHHVVIFPDRHTLRVVPGCVSAAPGDVIFFESLEIGATIFLPDKNRIVHDPSKVPDVLSVEPAKLISVVLSKAAPLGVYPYAVFCRRGAGDSGDLKGFAVGNSDPTIIIRTRSE